MQPGCTINVSARSTCVRRRDARFGVVRSLPSLAWNMLFALGLGRLLAVLGFVLGGEGRFQFRMTNEAL